WVDTSSFMTEFLNRFFTNGATFGGFIETEEETEARIKLIKAGLLNDHVGVEKAHKLGVLPKGAKYAKATANMAELQMSETDDRTRDKILAGFGVPKSILGLTTDVNRANAEAMEYVFAKYTVKPIVDDFIEFMNTNVADVLDPSGRYYFAYDEFIPENAEVQLKERELALAKQPYMTVNEVRATKGLPPVPGGDAVYGNPAFLPLGEPAPEPAAPANDDEDDDGEPKRALPSRARKSFSRVRSLEGFSSAVAKKVLEISTAADPDSESHKAFVGRVEDHQDLIADKVRDFNAQQERDVLGNLRQAVKAVTKDELFDEAAAVSVMVDFITPTLTGLFVEQAIAEFTAQGFEGRLDQSQPRIAALIATAAKRLAKNYNETTATLLLAQINEGIRDGEGLDKLSERVRQVYAFSNEHRAAQVARTEAFYIANEGSKEAYRQSGVVKTMRWYTSESERVCEFCAPQHGRVIGVSEVFFPKGHELIGEQGGKMTLNYRTIDVPPLHPNCSCFIRPEEISVS
ncbi:MAG TPA: phage portal protein, partial [Archangium sp.]